jgi:two-component system sensor histidine kinase YesM
MRINAFKSFFLNKSLFSRIFLSYLLLIIFPISLIGFLSFKASEQIISRQLSLSNGNTLNQIEKNISFLLDQIITVVNIYNQNNDLETELCKVETNPLLNLKSMQRVQSKMFKYSDALGWMKQQTILIGKNHNTYNLPDGTSKVTFGNIRHYQWYAPMMRDLEQIYWLPSQASFLTDFPNEHFFSALKPLTDGYSRDYYGILLISINEETIYEIYQNSLLANNRFLIIDSRGIVISSDERKQVGTKTKNGQYLKLIKDRTSDHQILTINHTRYLCNFKKIDKVDWYIIASIPLSTIFKVSRTLGLKIFIISLVCLVLSLIAAIFFSRKISLPLIQLSRRFKKISPEKGETAKPSFIWEIDFLNVEYEHLVIKLEQTINNLIKKEKEKRHAELAALQMQINPHFLYNTLNSIKCLVWTNQSSQVEPTINALVTLLEQTLNRGNELITIAAELENIKNYMFIQEIRTCNPIEVQTRINPELLRYKIPRLILQPIIENAIFHGIEPKKQKGSISIYCIVQGDNLQIEIRDDGIGMDPTTIATVLNGTQPPSSNRLSGIGIKNVDERLKLSFGPQYGLSIKSAPGIGTVVTLILPKIL